MRLDWVHSKWSKQAVDICIEPNRRRKMAMQLALLLSARPKWYKYVHCTMHLCLFLWLCFHSCHFNFAAALSSFLNVWAVRMMMCKRRKRLKNEIIIIFQFRWSRFICRFRSFWVRNDSRTTFKLCIQFFLFMSPANSSHWKIAHTVLTQHFILLHGKATEKKKMKKEWKEEKQSS